MAEERDETMHSSLAENLKRIQNEAPRPRCSACRGGILQPYRVSFMQRLIPQWNILRDDGGRLGEFRGLDVSSTYDGEIEYHCDHCLAAILVKQRVEIGAGRIDFWPPSDA